MSENNNSHDEPSTPTPNPRPPSLSSTSSTDTHPNQQPTSPHSDSIPEMVTSSSDSDGDENPSDAEHDYEDDEHEHGGGYWCHQCQEEISALLDSGTPTCPHCHSEFVEEMEESTRQFIAEHESDDEEDDHVFVFGGPAGGTNGAGQAGDMAQVLQHWLQQMVGNQANIEVEEEEVNGDDQEEGHARAAEEQGESAGGNAAAAEGPDGEQQQQQRSRTTGQGRNAPNLGIRTGPDGLLTVDLTTLLEGLFGAASGNGDAPNNPFRNLFNMVGNPGDYVFGQRGLDDIITQLMEQTSQRNAPPPAPTETMESLPKIAISRFDIQDHGECPICQEDYQENEIVTALPCKHLFHPDCIESWLKVNGTCPVCRYSLISTSTPEQQPSEDDARPVASS